MRLFVGILFLSFLFSSCQAQSVERDSVIPLKNITDFDSTYKTIHVLVALCDNKYQGIVPVPKGIGNGQDPNNNLYWGCGFGTRTFFKNSAEWKLLSKRKVDSLRLERLIFKHASKKYYMVADAYDGKYIRNCTEDLLHACAGQLKDTVQVGNVALGIFGNAALLGYIGHDGLMDFSLENEYKNADGRSRDMIILACFSKRYFAKYLQSASANPLVWTTGLMCPEAYTMHDAISGFVNNETREQIRSRAALAYAKYQKCGVGPARNLLVTGF